MKTIDNLVQECHARNSHGLLLRRAKEKALTLTRSGWGDTVSGNAPQRRWTVVDGREGGPGPAGSVSAACLGRGDGVRTGMGGILSSCTLVVAAHSVNLCVSVVNQIFYFQYINLSERVNSNFFFSFVFLTLNPIGFHLYTYY